MQPAKWGRVYLMFAACSVTQNWALVSPGQKKPNTPGLFVLDLTANLYTAAACRIRHIEHGYNALNASRSHRSSSRHHLRLLLVY